MSLSDFTWNGYCYTFNLPDGSRYRISPRIGDKWAVDHRDTKGQWAFGPFCNTPEATLT